MAVHTLILMLIQKTDVRVLSYNIFMRPYTIKTNADDFKSERLELLVSEMVKYDIVCLQEAFDNFTHRQFLLCEKAYERGFKYSVRSPNPALFGKHIIDGGLIVFSKLPILETDFYSYKHSIFSDALSEKGVLYIKIKLPEGVLHVFTTHDQAHYKNDDKITEIANHYVRLKQMVEARNFINRKLALVMNRQDTALFMGDLNVDANFTEYPIKEAEVFFNKAFCDEDDYCKLTHNEYDLLLYILNNSKVGFPCSDIFYNQHTRFIATYADSYIDENGREKPRVS